MPGVTDSACLDAVSDVCGTVGATEGERRVQVPAVPPAFVRRLPRRRALILEGDLAPVVVKVRPAWARLAARLRLQAAPPVLDAALDAAWDTEIPAPGWATTAPDLTGVLAGPPATPAGLPGRQDGEDTDRVTGTPDTTPEGEDPAAEARRLQEELERARQAGSPIPYETLAALAARLSDLGAKVRHLDAVVDRSGLVMAKDIRVRVGRLTAEVDAMGARLQEVEDQVAELASKGARVPAPNWSAMDQSTRAAELARLSEWVTRVLVPSQAWPRGKELRPCWRAHWPVIWELGVIWAEWRRVYGREAPELAGALELEGRWLPGALERVQPRPGRLPPPRVHPDRHDAPAAHVKPSPEPHWTPAPQPCAGDPSMSAARPRLGAERPRVWRWSRCPRPRTESGQRPCAAAYRLMRSSAPWPRVIRTRRSWWSSRRPTPGPWIFWRSTWPRSPRTRFWRPRAGTWRKVLGALDYWSELAATGVPSAQRSRDAAA